MLTDNIFVGLSTTYEKVITPADSYLTKSITIDHIMSTPALLATIIEVSWNMLKQLIPDGYITVVRNFNFNHLNPTLVGEKIKIKITVEKIDNNRIYMTFLGTDYIGEFCNGNFEKAIVRSDKLLEAAYKRVRM
ncbi:thioesterase, FlK family [Sedimentibacter sp.]|uniref:thioesterase family protein n=1 Tax=Sedimentibacter sp. TaxID=1960295 RepID=UPI00289E2EF7|nr:hypothetical protein [Sedimentibacter sp.]